MPTFETIVPARPAHKLVLTINDMDDNNIAANTSRWSWSASVVERYQWGSFNYYTPPSPHAPTWKVIVNGKTVGKGFWTFDYRDPSLNSTHLGSGTVTLKHAVDGTLNVTASASITGVPMGSTSFVTAATAGGGIEATRNPRGPRIRQDGTWKNTVMYVKQSGEWKIAIPYVKHDDTWKIAGG